MNRTLIDYYRCPDRFSSFILAKGLSANPGYFRFGKNIICYGRCGAVHGAETVKEAAYDAFEDVTVEGSTPHLPFDPSEVVDNLRYERYLGQRDASQSRLGAGKIIHNTYYLARPLLPVSIRRHLQKVHLKGWEKLPFPSWPVDCTIELIHEKLLALSMQARGVERVPFIWFWPEGHSGCAIMTHDVEQPAGLEFCPKLMDIESSAGIKASFQLVPEKRYAVRSEIVKSIQDRGFEVNVHDFNHDGNLYRDKNEFHRRAEKINFYAKQFGATGFRSGALYRNLEWYDTYDFSYDMSVPNVAHLDPQRGGCCTVMPYFVGKILELPLTTTQDYSLFHIFGDYSIDLWKRQIELILEKHGLISFIIHPDYVIEERAQKIYRELLGYLSDLRARDNIWIPLPRDLDHWWRARSQMNLESEGGKWRIEGTGSERARVAFATLDGDNLKYSIGDSPEPT